MEKFDRLPTKGLGPGHAAGHAAGEGLGPGPSEGSGEGLGPGLGPDLSPDLSPDLGAGGYGPNAPPPPPRDLLLYGRTAKRGPQLERQNFWPAISIISDGSMAASGMEERRTMEKMREADDLERRADGADLSPGLDPGMGGGRGESNRMQKRQNR